MEPALSTPLALCAPLTVRLLSRCLLLLPRSQAAQQARIDVLERNAASSVSLSSFQSLSSRLESTIEHLNAQFGAIDQRLAEMGDEMSEVQKTLATLPELRAQVEAKVDATLWRSRADEARASLQEQIVALKADKSSKQVVSSLEQSQHRLVEEVLALQKMLSCKIDRVEVPLLDVASEKLQFLMDFQSAADARLDKSEHDIQHLAKAVHTKESKDSAAKTNAALRDEIARKVDATFIREQVLGQCSSRAIERSSEHSRRTKARL